ncbi:unnamed protein product, partial [Meganyctiphanes norvegica]
MSGRIGLLVLLVTVATVSARAQERDWAQHYNDRYNLGNQQTRPSNVKVGNRRGDMSPEMAGHVINPVEVDTSDIDGARPIVPNTRPLRPRQPPQDTQPRRTPTRPPPPTRPPVVIHPSPTRPPVIISGNQRPLPVQRDQPQIFLDRESKMTVEERKAILTTYRTILQLSEGLNKDLAEAKRLPLCGANGPTKTLDSLQARVGAIQAALEILILVIRDSFTEVSLGTNIYQNLEVVYEVLVSIQVTTEDIKTQIVQQDDSGAALTVYCPHPYQAVGDQCLYLETTSTATWHHARTQCKRRGGDLVVPHNLYLLQSHILEQRPAQRSLEFWLGGSDIANENGWEWISGALMDMTNGWNPGEPNEDRGGEDCVMLLDKDYPPLNDARCQKDSLHYICEAPTSYQPPEPQHPTEKPEKDDFTQGCGAVDVPSGPSCFYISPSTEYVPWFKARQACKEKGGSLAQSYNQEVIDYVMGNCGEKRWYWMGPSELDNIEASAEHQVDLVMKTCHVFDAGQDGQPQLSRAACEGDWHFICQKPC